LREAARNKVRATLAPARRPGLLRSQRNAAVQGRRQRHHSERDRGGRLLCYGFFAPLYDQRGEWTLTVTELVGFDLAGPGEQTRLAGPWVIRFRVP